MIQDGLSKLIGKYSSTRNILCFSLVLLFLSILGTNVLCDKEIVFEPYSVKVWDTGFLFRESVISLHAYDRTEGFNESWKFLMMYIMDDSQYQSYVETNTRDAFKPKGNNQEGIKSIVSTHIEYRVPYEDNWHVILINKKPASHEDIEKTYLIDLEVDQKAGALRYPAVIGLVTAAVRYHRKKSKAGTSQSVIAEELFFDTT